MKNVNLKKNRKAGICAAMRCKKASVEAAGDIVDGIELCDRHARWWNGVPSVQEWSPGLLPAPADEPTNGHATAATGPDQAAVLATVQPIEVEAKGMLAKLGKVTITNQASLDLAEPVLKKIKEQLEDVKAQKNAATKPLIEARKVIEGWFRPATDALIGCERALKSAIVEFLQQQESTKVKLLQNGDHERAMAVEPAKLPSGMHTRTTYKWRVVDADKVPEKYWAIDATAVSAVVGELKGRTNIPGIEVYPDVGLTVRA